MNAKKEQYALLLKQASALLEGERDHTARMANLAALIHHSGIQDYWWTGFYRVEKGELLLGPFQGPIACMHIGYGKGVCGTAWKERRTVVVPDVEKFPGHIACSSLSRSEIVVPVVYNGDVVAVLDIDSRNLNAFDDSDRCGLEALAALAWPTEREIHLAAGCFWGAEHYLKLIDGVTFTEVGFANGKAEYERKQGNGAAGPSYQEVYTDQTGFAETVHLRYDPTRVSLRFLLEMYFKAIDPTSLNQQGEDHGTRYRTGIYYSDPGDLPVIEEVLHQEAKKYDKPLQVEVEPLRNFYRAEDYHQGYLDKHPDGYCHLPTALFELARKAKERR